MKDYSTLDIRNLSKKEELEIARKMCKAFSEEEYFDFYEKLPTTIHSNGVTEILLSKKMWQEAMNGSCAGAHVENIRFLKKFGFFNEALVDVKSQKYIRDGFASEWLYHLFTNFNDFSEQNVLDVLDELYKSGVRLDTLVKKIDLPLEEGGTGRSTKSPYGATMDIKDVLGFNFFEKYLKESRGMDLKESKILRSDFEITFLGSLVYRGAVEFLNKLEGEIPINGLSVEMERLSDKQLLVLAAKSLSLSEKACYLLEKSIYGEKAKKALIINFLKKEHSMSTIVPLCDAIASVLAQKEELIDWFISKKKLWKNHLNEHSMAQVQMASLLKKNFFNVSEFEIFKKLKTHNDWSSEKEEVLNFLHSELEDKIKDSCKKTSDNLEFGAQQDGVSKSFERKNVVYKDQVLNVNGRLANALGNFGKSTQTVELSVQELFALCILQGARVHCSEQEQGFFSKKKKENIKQKSNVNKVLGGFDLLIKRNLKKMLSERWIYRLEKEEEGGKKNGVNNANAIPGTKEVIDILKKNDGGKAHLCEISCKVEELFEYVDKLIYEKRNDLIAELLFVLLSAKKVGYFNVLKDIASNGKDVELVYDKKAEELFAAILFRVPKEVFLMPISVFGNHSLLHAFFLLDDSKTIEKVFEKYPEVFVSSVLKEKTIWQILSGPANEENACQAVVSPLDKGIKINGVLELAVGANSKNVLEFIRKKLNEEMIFEKNENVLNEQLIHLLLGFSITKMSKENKTNLVHQDFCREFLKEIITVCSMSIRAKNENKLDVLGALNHMDEVRQSMWHTPNELIKYDSFKNQIETMLAAAEMDLQIDSHLEKLSKELKKGTIVQRVKIL